MLHCCRWIRFAALLVAGVLLLPAAASAALITFVHSGTAAQINGTIDGSPFSTTQFTITATGDTNARLSPGPGVFFINHTAATIDILGVGTFAFVSPTRTFFNDNNNIVGFARGGFGGLDLFDGPISASLDGWDMETSIGPVTGPAGLVQWGNPFPPVNTSDGVLIFADQTVTGTFTATVAAAPVPEPSTLAMFGLGGLGLAFGAIRRRFRKVA